MIYACENCGFIFQRTSEISKCPTCDKGCIREATNEEAERLPAIRSMKKKVG